MAGASFKKLMNYILGDEDTQEDYDEEEYNSDYQDEYETEEENEGEALSTVSYTHLRAHETGT